MAAYVHHMSPHVCKITFFYLAVSCVFAQFSYANYTYSKQPYSHINYQCPNVVLEYLFNFIHSTTVNKGRASVQVWVMS